MDENNSTQRLTSDKHNIIYFTNNENVKEEQEGVQTSPKKIEATRYIAPVIISILIYSICAWATKAGFVEILDLELPFLIILTLILTESVIQGFAKYSYPLYVLAGIIVYSVSKNYALFIIIALTGVLVSRCLEEIYYNRYDYPNMNDDDFNIKSFVSRIKYHILLSLLLFVIFLILGYFYPGVFQPLVMPSVENLHNGVQEGTVKLETIPLFINNFSVAANMILSGFYLSTYTVYLLVFNALFIGFSGAITNIKYFLAFTLPHGIIELFAIILSCAAGLRITHALLVLLNGIKLNMENKSEIFADACNNFVKMFIDVAILIILIVIMLLVAAFIEANLTITIGTFLYNF
ncbi:stage II sporulation protein M [Methanosphaera sp. ISO3-F5]|uniref:stage II sporulation protein M n=1 Tax=Methanosphaera sp. ISO3-F5 TaxID=1452353 RepID=UPI002B257181|nr:stage II sporulation protein M [Methanosphaera sp. ISO3-F5]WQH64199.1 stage II sporulation protein M [Methanosphaera sp. ISO3-F5]